VPDAKASGAVTRLAVSAVAMSVFMVLLLIQ